MVPGFESRYRQEGLLFSKTSRLTLGPTQPPIRLVLGFFVGGKLAGGMILTTHLHLVPKLRRSTTMPPFSLYVFMAWSGKFLFYPPPPTSPALFTDSPKRGCLALTQPLQAMSGTGPDDKARPLPRQLNPTAHYHQLIRRDSLSYQQRR
jgi:hypothetical protein